MHILLDRLLVKDSNHLVHAVPLYGRLSRVEKRAAIVKFSTALVQREDLIRNILVDTVVMCVFEACDAEGRLEAPVNAERRGGAGGGAGGKQRLPFMQKVIGDAFAEVLAEGGGEQREAYREQLAQLTRQKASPAER